MKKTLLLAVAILFAFAGYSNSKYTINDNQVEKVLTESVQVNFELDANQMESILETTSIQGEPNAWVAFALSWVLGGIGVHRVYLGGKGSLILIYFITCGGIFGIVPFIDWIVLLVGAIKGDISQFVDNDKFFMWAN